MKLLLACAVFALTSAAASSDSKPPQLKPCTIRSPSTGGFFDLSPLNLEAAKDDKSKKTDAHESWHARGYDYGANFTLNFCGPVVEDLKDVEDIDSSLRKNVSAYYVKNKRVYSIGSSNTELVIRGRKLVLNYTGGSLCEPKHGKRSLVSDLERRAAENNKPSHTTRRKSAILSLLCDNNNLDPKAPKVQISFVGTDEDECVYFFEARSAYACAGIETTPQQLGPGGVFGVIMLIAVLVYLLGGCVYQRTVMHQRGWKQLPNYSMWAGIFNFVIDMFIILTSSCARCMPWRRGYSRVSLHGSSRGRGIYSSHDDENRLIDQLDEDWDD